jgi:hypothetical protein
VTLYQSAQDYTATIRTLEGRGDTAPDPAVVPLCPGRS